MPAFAVRLRSIARATTDEREFKLALLLAAATLWLVSHPYRGLFQDANLYVVMALRWLNAKAFARDPMFLFGSQDDFNLFSPLYAGLIAALGVSSAAQVVVLVGAISWLAASWLAARRIFLDDFPRGVAFLCCAVFSLSYSPAGDTFVLNENFATARVLAMPLGVAAVALGSRSVVAWLLAFGATVLHPLLGIWCVLILVSTRCTDRQLLAIVCAAAAAFALAVANGFNTLLQPVSAERLQLLRASTTDLLVTGAELSRVNTVLFWLGALLLGSRFGSEPFRRCYLAIALVSALGYLLSAVASLYLPIDIVLQGQPWRAVWLAAFFSVFALVDVGWKVCRDPRFGWRYVLLSASVLMLCKPVAGPLLCLGWLVTRFNVARAAAAERLPMTATAANLVVGMAALIALPAWLADVGLEGESLSLFGWTGESTLRGIVGGGAYGVGPVLMCALLCSRRLRRGVIVLLLLPGLAWSMLGWDSRAAPTRTWESSLRATAPEVVPGLRPGQTVYWPNGLPQVWFGLGTAGYVGTYHLSGLVFSEAKTAMVMARWQRAAVASIVQRPVRGEDDVAAALEAFRVQHPGRDFNGAQTGSYVAESLTAYGVSFLCTDTDLDWVVADFPHVSGVAGIGFTMPGEAGIRRYAYACAPWQGPPKKR